MEPIRLTSRVYSLSQVANTYEALSYCWGPGRPTRYVTLNNRPGFAVSEHLEQALKRLRLATNVRLVWIDAVCINQASVTEMNHQVKLMGRIYQLARRTIIWIGELTPNKTTCNRLVPAEGDDRDMCTLCCREPRGARDDHGFRATILGPLRTFITGLAAVQSHDAWHHRLWCVQEFHFSQASPSVYVGAHAISWSHYKAVFNEACLNSIMTNNPLDLFGTLRTNSRSLHDLCRITGAQRTGDQRDRVYALLNMSTEYPDKPEPDYQKSILEVFEETTVFFIRQSNSMNVILDGRLDRTQQSNCSAGILPTFVPDFTQLIDQETVRGVLGYDAGNGSIARVNLFADSQFVRSTHDEVTSAVPRVLGFYGRTFEIIKHRTVVGDYPDYETSPDGRLIYNSFIRPGRLIEKILGTLQLYFEPNMSRLNLNRTPQLGRLILEYLLEETRNHDEIINSCVQPANIDLVSLYERELLRDRSYLEQVYNLSAAQRAREQREQTFVTTHWHRRQTYVHEDDGRKLDLRKILGERENDWPWNQILSITDGTLSEDVQAAMEFENLFCYARKMETNYHLFEASQAGHPNHHRPMRQDVLNCPQVDLVPGLRTQAQHPDDIIDRHPYNEKARKRDFFATENGFIGLGPSTLRVEDLVVVPSGCSRPLILRPCGESNHYTLIGEVIVPGIMHGEWHGNADDLKTFYLR